MTTILLGAGGTGSLLAEPLARAMRGETLIVIDGDTVEDRNLARQAFSVFDIGSNKAEMVAHGLRMKSLDAIAAPRYLDATNIESMLHEGDTVLITIDNFPTRALIDRYAANLWNFTIINGGNEVDTSSCQVHIRRKGADVTPRISYQHPEITRPGKDRSAMTCAELAATAGNEQTIAANMMSAAWMLRAFMDVRAADNDQALMDALVWHELHVDMSRGIAGHVDWREMSDDWQTPHHGAPA